MILLYASHPNDRAELHAACGVLGSVRSTSDWEEFISEWPRADCLVVEVASRDDRLVTDLERLRFVRPVLPLVLITARAYDILRRLGPISADAIVDRHRIGEDLPSVLQEAPVDRALGRMAKLIEGAAALDPLIINSVSALCRARPPIRTVGRLARHVDTARETLARHWHDCGASIVGLRLEDMIAGVRLYHGVRTLGAHDTWEAIAGDVGVDRRTLLAWAHRLVGCSLRDLRRIGGAEASRRIASRLFIPLLNAHTASGGAWRFGRPSSSHVPADFSHISSSVRSPAVRRFAV